MDRDASLKESNDFEKLKLMIWNNLLTTVRKKAFVTFFLISPIVFCLLLISARMRVRVEVTGSNAFTEFTDDVYFDSLVNLLMDRHRVLLDKGAPMNTSVFAPMMVLAWAPRGYTGFANIIYAAAERFQRIEIVSFKDCRQLKENFQKNHFLAGVCFDDTEFIESKTPPKLIFGLYPYHLNFTLIFPSELRIYRDEFIGATWMNNDIFPPWEDVGKRIHSDFDGGFVGYIREGFTHIQAQISEAYIDLIRMNEPIMDADEIKSRRKELPRIPPVFLQRMPYMKHDYDPLLYRISIPIVISTMLIYLVMGLLITTDIVEWKQRGLTSALMALGVTKWIYLSSRFATDFILFAVCSFVFTAVLNVSWNAGFHILSKTSFTALFFILLCYSVVTITFFMMLTAFFRSTIYVAFITPCIWMLTFIPCLTIFNDSRASVSDILLIVFLPNCTMGLIWQMIIYRETHAEGLTWAKFLQTDAGDKIFSVALCLLLFIIQSVASICIAVYWEDTHVLASIEKRWKTPKFIQKFQEKKNEKANVFKSNAVEVRKTPNTLYVLDRNRKKLIMTVNDMSFDYGETRILHNININMYEDEITILMGHNGSGKSTLCQVLAGVAPPASGNVMIENVDIYKEPSKVSGKISISYQDNRLLHNLTFKEHLYLFGQLKGLTKKQTNNIVERYCVHFGIKNQCKKLTQNLSSGIQHILSVCCATIGYSSVVLIDDFGTSLDAYTRMLLWELLILEKYERTMIVSTNSFESLKVLADRIVILSQGVVQCNGTTTFLKSIYDKGYRLMCIKAENCNTKYVTEFLDNYVPDITPTSDIGQRITYVISYEYKAEIPLILLELEINQTDLFLESFAIDDRTMEDAFLGMQDETSSDGNEVRQKQIMNGECQFAEENLKAKFLNRSRQLKGWKLWSEQINILIYKRFIETCQSKTVILTFIFLPMVLLVLPYILIDEAEKEPLAPLNFQLDIYPASTMIFTSWGLTGEMVDLDKILMSLASACKHCTYIQVIPMSYYEAIYKMQKQDLTFASKEMIVGAMLWKHALVAVYNNFPYHSVPIALNLVYRALTKTLFIEADISVAMENLEYSVTKSLEDFNLLVTRRLLLSFSIALIYALMFSYSVPFLSIEKRSKLKLLQYLNGARINTFWISTIVFDLLKISAMTMAVFIPILIIGNANLEIPEVTFFFWFALFSNGLVISLIGYLVALAFDPIAGFIVIILYHISGVSLFLMAIIIDWPQYVNGPVYSIIGFFLPCFNFARTLYSLQVYGDLRIICLQEQVNAISNLYENCKAFPNCCIENTVMSAFPGILTETSICLVQILVLIVVLFVYEYISTWRPVWLIKPPPNDDLSESETAHIKNHAPHPYFNHDDVTMEDIRVRTLVPFLFQNKALIVKNIGRKFGNNRAVKRLNIMVEKHQIFGILGAIGTGKTALINLLTGKDRLTHGCIYINGLLLHMHPQRCFKNINYSPQIPAGMDNFSPKEILTIFARLNGVPKHSTLRYCGSLAKVLGFHNTYYKKLSHCSAGIKKRVSLAIALMGDTIIKFIDDPCRSLDPGGKRMLHNIMEKMRQSGQTFILATYSINEAEGTCNRLAILVDNNIWSIGSTADLQKKFGLGYMLILRMMSDVRQSKNSDLPLISHVESMFPGAAFRVRRSNCLYFFLQQQSNTLANIFEKISGILSLHKINDFAISRCTLETIFLDHQEQYIHLKLHGII